MRFIDNWLNKITMYRLVVYGLAILATFGIFFAGVGRISLSPIAMWVSLGVLLASCLVTEIILSKVWQGPFNHESWLITSFIIFLILRPPRNLAEAIAAVGAGILAVASKYLVSWHGRHIFNPAALAAAAMSLSGLQITSWWVGNSAMWPITLILGLAIVRKVRRFPMVLTFAVVSIVVQNILLAHSHQLQLVQIKSLLVSSPLIFLATIMLTEPATMPASRNRQMLFAALIGLLYATAWKLGPLFVYPEVALLIGNVLAFIISPKFKAELKLKQVNKISNQVYDFVFSPNRKFAFEPGQYVELTLPNVPIDSRGNRRTFTIASSPTEDAVHFGIKFYDPSSAFKHTLSQLRTGDTAYASQLSGHFTLSGNEAKKLVFIAGGIGITPFRSMIKYLTDQQIKSDIVLIYLVSAPEELAYKTELLAARPLGVKLLPVLTNSQVRTDGMVNAQLSEELIQKTIPDYQDRIFYVSGPNGMVMAAKSVLTDMGISRSKIKTDYFAGY